MSNDNLQTIRWKLMSQDTFEPGSPVLKAAEGLGVLEALEKFWASVLGDAFGNYWLVFEEDEEMFLETGDYLELPKCGLDFSDNTIDRLKHRNQLKRMREKEFDKEIAKKHLKNWLSVGGSMKNASETLFG